MIAIHLVHVILVPRDMFGMLLELNAYPQVAIAQAHNIMMWTVEIAIFV